MPRTLPILLVAAATCTAACTGGQKVQTAGSPPTAIDRTRAVDPQALQSAVMSMSDDWNIALGESMFALQGTPGIDLPTRLNGISFLRNGMGSSLDIAVGPNPRVSMLDMLVLASLQTWALEHTWGGHGIPSHLVGPAKARLEEARIEMRSKASSFLAPDQLAELDRLIGAWVQAHPRQVLVSFVRLSDFANDRNELTLEDRTLAQGLLREVTDVTSAIDDARLLGERALWYAARYPYVLGQQAEQTSLRVTDMVSQAAASQREAFFEQLSRERAETIRQVEQASKELLPIISEARETITGARALGEQTLRIVQAIDGLVARFDHAPGSEGGVNTTDVRDILREAGASADRVAELVRASDALTGSPRWERAAATADRIGTAAIDRAIWGLAGIVVLLIAGLGLLRLIPQRSR